MPIAKDLSDLPSSQAAQGWPPDETPLFVQTLVEKLRADEQAKHPDGKPTARGTRLRHSDAGKCSRALALGVAGAPRVPMDLPGYWVTGLGTIIHEAWQEAMIAKYGADVVVAEPECQVEGVDGSGHADAVITLQAVLLEPEKRILYELKTCGGFKFKKIVGERGPAEGPDLGHITQAALNARALGCDEIRIGYIATEAISKQAAAKKGIGELGRFVAEWTIPMDMASGLADAEIKRWGRILELVDDGKLAPRMIPHAIPVGAEIVDVKNGRWEQRTSSGDVAASGTTWHCGYCAFQPTCGAVGGGLVPVDKLEALT